MGGSLWEAILALPLLSKVCLVVALATALVFEFVNGFHDAANAVATVIYTKTLRPAYAVIYSGLMNALGVLLGGSAVAFTIVRILPSDVLINNTSPRCILMLVSLLLAALIWNLATWWRGLPISSSHTLIGSILGVGFVDSLITRGDARGVEWSEVGEVAASLLISPIVGFLCAAGLLIVMRQIVRDPRLYEAPSEDQGPPTWIRGVLLATCGGVSFAHGSNDGQKGMGLMLLVLVGFLPAHYSLNLDRSSRADDVRQAAVAIHGMLDEREPQLLSPALQSDLAGIVSNLEGRATFGEIPMTDRWKLRQKIYRTEAAIKQAGLSRSDREAVAPHVAKLRSATEYIPTWIVVIVAIALGLGTTIGYKRILVTVAEKIGKTHMNYAQGAVAETVATITIGLADAFHLPVSTTQVLSSGVAGTMWANRSGVQADTLRKIGLAWILTLPAAFLISAGLFAGGHLFLPAAPLNTAATANLSADSAENLSPLHNAFIER